MGFDNYVSETEALQRSGISTKTLQRFVEAGYLSVEVEPDGLRLYSKAQLDEIFGIHTAPLSLEPIEEDKDGNPIEPSVVNHSVDLDDTAVAEERASFTTKQSSAVEPRATETHESWKNGSASNEAEQVVQSRSESSTSTSYYEQPSASSPVVASVNSEPPVALLDNSTDSTDSTPGLMDREIARLKNLVQLQETILDARDAEIRGLKDERQWLRTRIEKLEEKGERDQILLLSETQTIRKLIVVQEKRGAIKQLLTWVGLLPPEVSNDSSTKDVMRATPVKDFRQRSEGSSTAPSHDSDKKVANG